MFRNLDVSGIILGSNAGNPDLFRDCPQALRAKPLLHGSLCLVLADLLFTGHSNIRRRITCVTDIIIIPLEPEFSLEV